MDSKEIKDGLGILKGCRRQSYVKKENILYVEKIKEKQILTCWYSRRHERHKILYKNKEQERSFEIALIQCPV